MSGPTEKPWRDVGAVSDFQDGKFRIVTFGTQEVGVIRIDGEYFAMRNVCPHAWGPLCKGPLEQRLVGAAGAPELLHDMPVVACPWHGWEFDLRDGKCVSDPAWNVKTFKVREEGDRLLLQS